MDYKTLILSCLSKTEYVSRQQLCITTQLSDRKVRSYIEELRNDGCVIHSEKGYKLADTDKEYNKTRRIYESRIESQLTTLHAMFGAEKVLNFLHKQKLIIQQREIDQVLKDKKCTGCRRCDEHSLKQCVYAE